jgi:hypothetical protein
MSHVWQDQNDWLKFLPHLMNDIVLVQLKVCYWVTHFFLIAKHIKEMCPKLAQDERALSTPSIPYHNVVRNFMYIMV